MNFQKQIAYYAFEHSYLLFRNSSNKNTFYLETVLFQLSASYLCYKIQTMCAITEKFAQQIFVIDTIKYIGQLSFYMIG